MGWEGHTRVPAAHRAVTTWQRRPVLGSEQDPRPRSTSGSGTTPTGPAPWPSTAPASPPAGWNPIPPGMPVQEKSAVGPGPRMGRPRGWKGHPGRVQSLTRVDIGASVCPVHPLIHSSSRCSAPSGRCTDPAPGTNSRTKTVPAAGAVRTPVRTRASRVGILSPEARAHRASGHPAWS